MLGVGFRPLPDWTPIPVEDLPKYLESLALGVNTYLSQARFRGWRRTQLLSSVNASVARYRPLQGGSPVERRASAYGASEGL